MLPKFSSASKGEVNNTQGNRSCKKKKDYLSFNVHGRRFFVIF